MKHVAIIIDAYEKENIDETFYYNIIGHINAIDHIDTVIVATYDVKEYELTSENIFYTSSRDIIGEELYKTKTKQIKNSACNKRTSPIILDPESYRDNLKLTSHLYPYELFRHQQKIESIFFFGKAWDICVQSRPLGIEYWKYRGPTLCVAPQSCLYANDTYVNFDRLDATKNPGGWYNLNF